MGVTTGCPTCLYQCLEKKIACFSKLMLLMNVFLDKDNCSIRIIFFEFGVEVTQFDFSETAKAGRYLSCVQTTCKSLMSNFNTHTVISFYGTIFSVNHF